MDANTMEFIEERNGFAIRENKEDTKFPYYVFHPSFDGIYIDAFATLKGAEDLCDNEDLDECAAEIEDGLINTLKK